MSDKLIVALALVPMFAGLGLVGILQRPLAKSAALEGPASTLVRGVADDTLRDGYAGFPGVVIPAKSAEVAAESDGRIARVWAHSGDHLKRGDAILQIDRSDVDTGIAGASAEHEQRRSEEARADARLARARDSLARLTQGSAWLSAQELETSRSELLVAQAEVAAARSATAMSKARIRQIQLKAQRHVVTAPFDGILVSSELDIGDSVSGGQVLARVVSEDRRVRFGMPREYVPRQGTLEVTLQLNERAPRVRAKVIDIRPEVDAAAQLVVAVALPDTNVARGPEWVLGARVIVQPTKGFPISHPEL
jgi:RND family efflux transporter MFP subunit